MRVDENGLRVCPRCGRYPTLGYCSGRNYWYVNGYNTCEFCGEFFETDMSKEQEVERWNRAVADELEFGCPFGGDETDDCEGCAYSTDHHFVNGKCVERDSDTVNDV